MMDSYNFFLITGLVLGVYFLTRGLKFHRQLWNMILLVFFLISGFLGLLLAFAIDQKMPLLQYRTILWIHVEAGIIMAIVSIFHTLWHIPYFKGIFKKN
ncbi:MAG TPA: hypothetical protein VN174_02865 [Candidatus Methanoperedens sp.]|nr:hypothetical protein [Candidatus Methanoperedens sp.]